MYDELIDQFQRWQPPMRLTFRSAPNKSGSLCRLMSGVTASKDEMVWSEGFYHLTQGNLIFYQGMDGESKPVGCVGLVGMAVSLVPPAQVNGALFCFQIIYGYDRIIFKANSLDEMYEWSCAFYYGIAIFNGGGYVLSMLKRRIMSNLSRDEVESAAMANSKSVNNEWGYLGETVASH